MRNKIYKKWQQNINQPTKKSNKISKQLKKNTKISSKNSMKKRHNSSRIKKETENHHFYLKLKTLERRLNRLSEKRQIWKIRFNDLRGMLRNLLRRMERLLRNEVKRERSCKRYTLYILGY